MLARLISTLGLATLRQEIAGTVRRGMMRAAMATVAVLFWLIAFGFALGALTAWLAATFGAVIACAIIAAGFAIIALVLHFIGAASARRDAPPSLASVVDEMENRETAPEENPLGTLAVVALVGYIMGRYFVRR